MTAHPVHGGTRYDAEWADVLDAEFWARIRRMSAAAARSSRAALFFRRARAAR